MKYILPILIACGLLFNVGCATLKDPDGPATVVKKVEPFLEPVAFVATTLVLDSVEKDEEKKKIAGEMRVVSGAILALAGDEPPTPDNFASFLRQVVPEKPIYAAFSTELSNLYGYVHQRASENNNAKAIGMGLKALARGINLAANVVDPPVTTVVIAGPADGSK